MKWFKPYECDNTVKNPLICDYSNLGDYGFSKWDLIKGEEIKNWDDTIIFQSKKIMVNPMMFYKIILVFLFILQD